MTWLIQLVAETLTAAIRVRAWVSPCGICGGQNDTLEGFSPSC
jgi:hypothetical protein